MTRWARFGSRSISNLLFARTYFASRQAQAHQIELPIFRDAPVLGSRNQDRRQLSQPPHHILGVVRSPHLREAGSKKPIRGRPTRIFLQGEQKHRFRFVETPGEEVSDANSEPSRGFATGVEPQGLFEVLDSKVCLPAPRPEPATPLPTNGEAWIELQCPIYKGECWIDISLEIAKHIGSLPENIRVVCCCSKRPTGILDTLLAIPFLILAPSIEMKTEVTTGDQRESRAVVRVVF